MQREFVDNTMIIVCVTQLLNKFSDLSWLPAFFLLCLLINDGPNFRSKADNAAELIGLFLHSREKERRNGKYCKGQQRES